MARTQWGLACALAFTASAPAQAQPASTEPVLSLSKGSGQAYPARAIRIIAEKLSMSWGQPVIVDNRAGAAGNIGAAMVFNAEADGYTLLSAPPPPLVINQSLYPRLAFDPARFVPVTMMALFMKQDAQRWRTVIRAANVTLD